MKISAREDNVVLTLAPWNLTTKYINSAQGTKASTFEVSLSNKNFVAIFTFS